MSCVLAKLLSYNHSSELPYQSDNDKWSVLRGFRGVYRYSVKPALSGHTSASDIYACVHNTFFDKISFYLHQTLSSNLSLESSWKDDSNEW